MSTRLYYIVILHTACAQEVSARPKPLTDNRYFNFIFMFQITPLPPFFPRGRLLFFVTTVTSVAGIESGASPPLFLFDVLLEQCS